MRRCATLKSFALLPVSGVIGIGKPVDMSETRGALHAFNIPLIAVGHDSGYTGARNYDNILSTAPDVQGQAEVNHTYLLTYLRILSSKVLEKYLIVEMTKIN